MTYDVIKNARAHNLCTMIILLHVSQLLIKKGKKAIYRDQIYSYKIIKSEMNVCLPHTPGKSEGRKEHYELFLFHDWVTDYTFPKNTDTKNSL